MNRPASPVEVLPDQWVNQIWKKLSIRFGRQFLARWDGVDLEDVKADWAEQLAGFICRPDCIAYALDNLPSDKPPTATQFRDLCRARPETSHAPQLDMKRGPIPANVMQALDRLKEPLEIAAQYAGPKGWAYRLRDREAQGDKLILIQRRFWREALRTQSQEPSSHPPTAGTAVGAVDGRLPP